MMSGYAVRYSPAALEDIDEMYSYIAFELMAQQAAEGQVNRIRRGIRSLHAFPEKHALVDWEPWASMGMRLMPVDRYIVYYYSEANTMTVTIVRIIYSGRDVKKLIQDEEFQDGPWEQD